MASYHGEDMMGVSERKRLLLKLSSQIVKHLKKQKIAKKRLFLVGSGLSGVGLAGTLSYILRCRWGFVRKIEDKFHHGGRGDELVQQADYIIAVDDFVSTGATMRYIADSIEIDAVCTSPSYDRQKPIDVHTDIKLDHLCIIMPSGIYIPKGE